MKNNYYSKLYYLLKVDYLIKKIDLYYFSNLLINLKNCIYWFDQLWVFEKLNLLAIKKIYDQIAFGYSSH